MFAPKVITGAITGGIKFWDVRTMKTYKTIEVIFVVGIIIAVIN